MLQARLSHVALRSADLAGAHRFCEDVVGLRTVGADSRRTRLAVGSAAHVLELHHGHGLDHFALEVADDTQLSACRSAFPDTGPLSNRPRMPTIRAE